MAKSSPAGKSGIRVFVEDDNELYETLEEKIGEGFNRVNKVRKRVDTKLLACKIIKLEIPSDTNQVNERVMQELIGMMATKVWGDAVLPHDVAINNARTEIRIYMTFCNLGSLKDQISLFKRASSHLREMLILEIFWKLAVGLMNIHSTSYIFHRDIKPGNVLLHSPKTFSAEGHAEWHREARVFLADWGSSKCYKGLLVDAAAAIDTVGHGTTHFIAPECRGNDPKYSAKSDIYALGYTMFCLCELRESLGASESQRMSTGSLNVNVPKSGTANKWSKDCKDLYSEDLRGLIDQCTDDDPNKRPSTVNEIVSKLLGWMRDRGTIEHKGISYTGKQIREWRA